jgi:glutamyl-tRNA synthetase
MKISHVIRGEEWLSSLPKHILLYQSLGWSPPQFIHLPLLLNPDKSKLSKRQGDVDVDAFLNKGYLKEAIINFIALLGWHPNNDNEIFNSDELIDNFSIKRIQKSGAIFDIKKLDWMNSQYIKKLSIEELLDISSDFISNDFDISDRQKLIKVFTFIKDRINKLSDVTDLLSPFYENINISDNNILDCINNGLSQEIIKYWLKKLLLIDNMDKESIDLLIQQTSKNLEVSGKQIFFPLRAVLYGKLQGPDLYTIISILGISESIIRLKKYI